MRIWATFIVLLIVGPTGVGARHASADTADSPPPDFAFADLGGELLTSTPDGLETTPVPVNGLVGRYRVLLKSADPSHEDPGFPSQPHEQWLLEGLDRDGTVVISTSPTADLPDQDWTKSDDVGIYDFTGVVAIRGRHARLGPDIDSIWPVQANLLAEGAGSDGVYVGQFGSRLLAPDVASSPSLAIDVPAGQYQVDLISSDPAHTDPDQGSQPNEQWYLEAYDGAEQLLFRTNAIRDLGDDELEISDPVGVYDFSDVESVRAHHVHGEGSPGSVVALAVELRADGGNPAPFFYPRADQVGPTSVGALWGAMPPETTSFRVLVDGRVVASLDRDSQSYVIADLKPDTTYQFGLEAVDAGGAVVTRLLQSARTAGEKGPAPPGGETKLEVLLLGDSYTAGNGAWQNSSFVSHPPDRCRRSITGWGEQYVDGLRQAAPDAVSVAATNRACSGAKLENFRSPTKIQTIAEGARKNGDTTWRCPPSEDDWYFTQRDVVTPPGVTTVYCDLYVRPQLDAVTSDTDLVLLTIGGNDLGFRTIVQDCFSSLPVIGADANKCQEAVGSARRKLPTVVQDLAGDNGLLAEIARRIGADGRVALLSYPHLQLDNGYTLESKPLYEAGREVRQLATDADRQLSEAIRRLNEAHPERARIVFVDAVKATFAGHEPDARAGNPQSYIYGMSGVPGGFPLRSNPDWYHPNPAGHRTIAALLLADYESFGLLART